MAEHRSPASAASGGLSGFGTALAVLLLSLTLLAALCAVGGVLLAACLGLIHVSLATVG